MTREDEALDPEIFLRRQPLTLYRLARARYANLSGVGAAQYPGRWNQHGQEAIYTSTEVGVPILERLVHTPKDLIPSNLALMTIRVAGQYEVNEENSLNIAIRDHFRLCRTLAIARKALTGFMWFAMAVPSVIVPVWNVVLYPEAPGFWDHVSLERVDPFEFDPRLFPEGTPVE